MKNFQNTHTDSS